MYKLSKSELLEAFNDQVEYIQSSINLFDGGQLNEARRIATALRILFHDTNQSHLLTGQLQVKNNLLFYSLANEYSPTNLLSSWMLLAVHMKIDNGSSFTHFVPRTVKDDHSRTFFLTFDDWWNQVIFDDREYRLTRRDIVLTIANKDGGAHVQGSLPDSYAHLVKQHSLGIMLGDGQPLIDNPALISIRAIADEFISSLELYHKRIVALHAFAGHDFEMHFFDDKKQQRFLWSSTDRSTSPEAMSLVNKYKYERRVDMGVAFTGDTKYREAIVPIGYNVKCNQDLLIK